MFEFPSNTQFGKASSAGKTPSGIFNAVVTRSVFQDQRIVRFSAVVGASVGPTVQQAETGIDAVIGSEAENNKVKVYCKIPRLAGDFEFGPVDYMGAPPKPGDRVFASFREGRQDEIVLITGSIGGDSTFLRADGQTPLDGILTVRNSAGRVGGKLYAVESSTANRLVLQGGDEAINTGTRFELRGTSDGGGIFAYGAGFAIMNQQLALHHTSEQFRILDSDGADYPNQNWVWSASPNTLTHHYIHSKQGLTVVGNQGVSTPDTVALSIDDDIDVRIRARINEPYPASIKILAQKRTAEGSDWAFRIDADGKLQFVWWDTSDVAHSHSTSASLGSLVNEFKAPWLRARRVGTDLQLYYSHDNVIDHSLVEWVWIETFVTAAGAINDDATALQIAGSGGSEDLTGATIFAFALLDTGTPVSVLDFTDTGQWIVGDDVGDTGNDAQGNVWTIGGTATIARRTVYWDYLTVSSSIDRIQLGGRGGVMITRQSDVHEGGQIYFQGGIPFTTEMYLDRYDDYLRAVINGNESARFGQHDARFLFGGEDLIINADGFAGTLGEFQSWTPSLTSTTGAPNLGTTGTSVGRYFRFGKYVYARFRITFGGTGITAGSGGWFVSYPVLPATATPQIGNSQLGHARYSITGHSTSGPLEFETDTTVQLTYYTTGAAAGNPVGVGAISSTNASGVAAGNFLEGWFIYEADGFS